MPRVDTPAKTDGTAEYALDVKRPGMLTAVIARPPRFGARLKSVDDSVAKSVPDVGDIVSWPGGVAVLARGFWAAKPPGMRSRSSGKTPAPKRAAATTSWPIIANCSNSPGVPVRDEGNAETAIAGAAKKFARGL